MRSFLLKLLLGLTVLVGASAAYADPPDGYELPGTTYIPQLGNQPDIQAQTLMSAGQKPMTVYDAGVQYPYLNNFGGIDPTHVATSTFLLGGRSYDDSLFLALSCRTYGGGDLGGACFNAEMGAGSRASRRDLTDSGFTQSLFKAQIDTSNPALIIGGNKLTYDVLGNIADVGNTATLSLNALVGDKTLTLDSTKDKIFCGTKESGQYCDVSLTNSSAVFKDTSGTSVSSLKVLSVSTDPTTKVTTLTLSGTVNSSLSSGTALKWHLYAPDGVAYGVIYKGGGIQTYPTMSNSLSAVFLSGKRLTIPVANNNTPTTGYDYGASTLGANYYFGFVSGVSSTLVGGAKSVVSVRTTPYPDAPSTLPVFRTLNQENIVPRSSDLVSHQKIASTAAATPASQSFILLNTSDLNSLSNLKLTLTSSSFPDTLVGYYDAKKQTHAMDGVVEITLSVSPSSDIPTNTTVLVAGQGVDNTTNYDPGNLYGDQDLTTSSTAVGLPSLPAPYALFTDAPYTKGLNLSFTPGGSDNLPSAVENLITFTNPNTSDTPLKPYTKGLTLSWNGVYAFDANSLALSVMGNNLLSKGIVLSGITDTGVLISTDSGVRFYSNKVKATASRGISDLGGILGFDNQYRVLGVNGIVDTLSPSGAYHLGFRDTADGTTSSLTGTPEVDLVWGAAGIQKSLSIVGEGDTPVIGLTVQSDGVVKLNGGLTLDGNWGALYDPNTHSVLYTSSKVTDLGVRLPALPLSAIKAVAGSGEGAFKYCADCVYYNTKGTLLHWSDVQGTWVDPDQMPAITTTYTYATLPVNFLQIGTTTYCGDCYSKLREDGDQILGIKVKWSGVRWDDLMGIQVQH